MTMTGDRDMVGGFFKDRIQFQHTTDSFPGLVKNALNKALIREWGQLGRAGYDWWQKIVRVEHFESLNDITWLLFGTVASLPTVAEGGEYTELKIGDSPETSSFVKKGGYIGLTLEAIDRDDGRRLSARSRVSSPTPDCAKSPPSSPPCSPTTPRSAPRSPTPARCSTTPPSPPRAATRTC